MKRLANILTLGRLLGSIVLLFLPVSSTGFYVTYLLCGLSDMADGPVARKTGSAGELGARLDTAADFLFAVSAFIKWLPRLKLPLWIWVWVLLIAVLRGLVFLRQRRVPHSRLNRITGFLLFILPLTLPFADAARSAAVVCAVATWAAALEWLSLS